MYVCVCACAYIVIFKYLNHTQWNKVITHRGIREMKKVKQQQKMHISVLGKVDIMVNRIFCTI